MGELLAQLVVGHFEPWDQIDFPLPETMSRLRVENLGQLIEESRAELRQLVPGGGSAVVHGGEVIEIPYFRLGVEPNDFLALLIDALEMKTVRVTRGMACQPQPVLVNCLDVSPERLACSRTTPSQAVTGHSYAMPHCRCIRNHGASRCSSLAAFARWLQPRGLNC